jgi:hypothetical protein
MRTLAHANASAQALVNVVARMFSTIRRALSRFGAALVRIQEARLEAEMRRIRHRSKPQDDDDRPNIII